jgi:alpha,alpha-trehalase
MTDTIALPAPVAAPASTPIADYGLLADCNSAALVDRAGSIDWLCLPRYDSAAIFARILGSDAGHWSIRPAGEFTSERRYLPGTLVIETTFSSLTIEALYIGACPDEAEEFVSFMTSAAGGRASEGSLQIMYGIGGEHDLSERELEHLTGWRESRPVRVGNGAWNQVQLDVYGELLNALHLYRARLGDLHPEIQAFVADLADTAARRWMERDSGIWEMRGEPLHHLSSKVLCWTALDRAVELAPQLGEHAKPDEWAAARDEIRAAILERGWSEKRQAFAQSFDSDELDAAVLLMPIYGFLPATDPRMRSTIDAVVRDLTEDGLVLRYRNQEGENADGLIGEEGTFVVCSFWLVSALAQAGEIERAEQLYAQLAGYANDLGLLAEEIDTATGEQLGNFPQAYSHIGLITAGYEIDRAKGRA